MSEGKVQSMSILPIDKLLGEIEVPGDKSVSHRAVMLGSLNKGQTHIKGFLYAQDTLCTINAFENMGVEILLKDKDVIINGKGLHGLQKPQRTLFLGNSGTTIRLISGILAGQLFETVLTGDEYLVKRPMKRIIEPLKLMGADISSIDDNGCAPLKIQGKELNAIEYETKIASAQVKSCILLAGLYAKGDTVVIEPEQSRDHTERMLGFFGIPVEKEGLQYTIKGVEEILAKDKEIQIPGDISSAAFFMTAGIITKNSEILIKKVGLNPTRSGIFSVLKRMGAQLEFTNYEEQYEPICDIHVKSSALKAVTIEHKEVPNIIDEIPILCVAAAKADGVTCIKGVQELRVKETDRIESMIKNLSLAGVKIWSEADDLFIEGSEEPFRGASFNSFGDHRTAMSMVIASLVADDQCEIHDIECINTSFPSFFETLSSLKSSS
ncbi:MAG: 3-phosphoshikimate 1-carboxyvinyltransferase [Candidatus Omnitrophica bacterium]|nr:3-phosphoshikimate 1-carboxyvinyltransferase [Candidatus Omnitrophota bacterium]